jgi:hypothetical protein
LSKRSETSISGSYSNFIKIALQAAGQDKIKKAFEDCRKAFGNWFNGGRLVQKGIIKKDGEMMLARMSLLLPKRRELLEDKLIEGVKAADIK